MKNVVGGDRPRRFWAAARSDRIPRRAFPVVRASPPLAPRPSRRRRDVLLLRRRRAPLRRGDAASPDARRARRDHLASRSPRRLSEASRRAREPRDGPRGEPRAWTSPHPGAPPRSPRRGPRGRRGPLGTTPRARSRPRSRTATPRRSPRGARRPLRARPPPAPPLGERDDDARAAAAYVAAAALGRLSPSRRTPSRSRRRQLRLTSP